MLLFWGLTFILRPENSYTTHLTGDDWLYICLILHLLHVLFQSLKGCFNTPENTTDRFYKKQEYLQYSYCDKFITERSLRIRDSNLSERWACIPTCCTHKHFTKSCSFLVRSESCWFQKLSLHGQCQWDHLLSSFLHFHCTGHLIEITLNTLSMTWLTTECTDTLTVISYCFAFQ